MLPKFKKEKVKVRTRVISQKTSNFIFIGGLLGLILFGSINIALNSYRLLQMEKNKPVVVSAKDSRNISNKVGLFMSDFLSAYFKQGQDVNSSQLTSYYGAGIDIKNKNTAFVESRLLSATLIEITDRLATYRVSYEVKKDDVPQTTTKVITIPYAEKDGKFYVSGLPYFSDIESYVAEGVKNDYMLKTQLETSKYQSEKSYVEAFFKAYASGDETQLVPFSKTIKPISGFQFMSLDYTYFTEENNKLIVLCQVSFSDDAGFTHQENFTLSLSRQDSGSYFVEDIQHKHIDIKEEE